MERLPDDSYKVLVLDDQGNGVTSAVVSVGGTNRIAITGQSGRCDLYATPIGVQRVTVDGSYASATDGDRLGRLQFTAPTPDGNELSYPVYLPNTADSSALTLATGLQAVAPPPLDDSGTSGATVTIAAGTTIGAGTAAEITLRTGSLQPGHLPAEFPPVASGARLVGRGVYIEPIDATFAPGADLAVVDDLQLSGGSAVELWHLDPVTGTWTQLGNGAAVSGGGELTATSAVTRGGLYAFGTTVADTATVIGRVVDDGGSTIEGALVQAGGRRTRTSGNGSFTLSGIAAVTADGMPRSVQVEFRGGRRYYPFATERSVTLSAGATIDTGDVTLSSFRVGTVRMMQITRGDIDPRRRMGLSSSETLFAVADVGDDRATVTFDEVPVRYFGFLAGRIKDDERVFVSQGVTFLQEGRNHLDLQVFSDEDLWFGGGRNSAVRIVDHFGGGPVFGAGLAIGTRPTEGFADATRESGILFVGRSLDERGTASYSSASEGRTVVSAFSVVDPNSQRLEMPLRRANRTQSGAFARHGLVRGALVGADPGAMLRVTGTRRMTLTDWYDEVVMGASAVGRVPRKLDPEVSGGVEFAIGVGAPVGNLAAVQVTDNAGVFTLDRLGLLASFAPLPGGELVADLSLDHVAGTQFTAPEALVGLSPVVPAADLRFDLAVELVDGTVADVARGIGGNHSVSSTDAVFSLPDLDGSLTGLAYRLAFGGEGSIGGKTVEQLTMLRFDGTGPAPVRFLPVPDIQAPAPGATVPAAGFRVAYTVPPGTTYVTIELSSDTGTVLRHWEVVAPPEVDSFDFIELPSQMVTPLIAGETYTLKVTAARIETGPLSRRDDAYINLAGNWVGISAAEREVNAFSSSSIEITTN